MHHYHHLQDMGHPYAKSHQNQRWSCFSGHGRGGRDSCSNVVLSWLLFNPLTAHLQSIAQPWASCRNFQQWVWKWGAILQFRNPTLTNFVWACFASISSRQHWLGLPLLIGVMYMISCTQRTTIVMPRKNGLQELIKPCLMRSEGFMEAMSLVVRSCRYSCKQPPISDRTGNTAFAVPIVQLNIYLEHAAATVSATEIFGILNMNNVANLENVK